MPGCIFVCKYVQEKHPSRLREKADRSLYSKPSSLFFSLLFTSFDTHLSSRLHMLEPSLPTLVNWLHGRRILNKLIWEIDEKSVECRLSKLAKPGLRAPYVNEQVYDEWKYGS